MATPLRENPFETQTPKPRRRRILRNTLIGIVLAIVALALVVGGLWFAVVFQEQQRVSVGDAFTAAGRYYGALQQQDYPTAYSYV